MLLRYVIASLALAGTLPAIAATATDVSLPTRVVSFDDLNLNSDAGISRLYARIKSAARDVCEPPELASGHAYMRERSCQDSAIARAVADVQSERLTSLHRSLTGR